jgi:hypothetical protein
MPRGSRNRRRADEAERYRQAAEAALEQLDWIIDYLYKIKRPGIAAAIERNRIRVAKRLQ